MLKGAELILTPNACTLEDHRIGQFKARAFENMAGLAMTNYAAPQQNGHMEHLLAIKSPFPVVTRLYTEDTPPANIRATRKR